MLDTTVETTQLLSGPTKQVIQFWIHLICNAYLEARQIDVFFYFLQIMILRRRLATPQQSHKMVLRERTSAPNSPCMFSPKLKHLSPTPKRHSPTTKRLSPMSKRCSPTSLKRPSPTEEHESGATPSKMIRPWVETPKSRNSSTPTRQGIQGWFLYSFLVQIVSSNKTQCTRLALDRFHWLVV